MQIRAQLDENSKIIIIWHAKLGFISEEARFLRYKKVLLNDINWPIPIFRHNDEELSGLNCFWILPTEICGADSIKRLQASLPALQIKALETCQELGYDMAEFNKMQNEELENVATENNQRKKKFEQLIEKHGFNPLDESWVETLLAADEREKKWFSFERTTGMVTATDPHKPIPWQAVVDFYNKEYSEKITIDEARRLSIKRRRFLEGSWHTRMQWVSDRRAWVTHAREFERKHRMIDERMDAWQKQHPDGVIVRTKAPARFWCGPLFNECLERIPYVFTDTDLSSVRIDVALKAVRYDPELKYIELDFIPEIKDKLLGTGHDLDRPSYVIDVRPSEVQDILGDLGSLG